MFDFYPLEAFFKVLFCLCFLMRVGKGVNPDRMEVREKKKREGEVAETIISIYCVRKEYILNKSK